MHLLSTWLQAGLHKHADQREPSPAEVWIPAPSFGIQEPGAAAVGAHPADDEVAEDPKTADGHEVLVEAKPAHDLRGVRELGGPPSGASKDTVRRRGVVRPAGAPGGLLEARAAASVPKEAAVAGPAPA